METRCSGDEFVPGGQTRRTRSAPSVTATRPALVSLQVAPRPSGCEQPPRQPCTHLNNSINALLFLEREKNRMPPGEVDGLELGEESLDEERKIPLKLMRRGERGGDSW